MYVTDDGDGGEHVDDIALAHEQFLGLGAYCLDHGLGEEFLLVQARYTLVEINRGGQARHFGWRFVILLLDCRHRPPQRGWRRWEEQRLWSRYVDGTRVVDFFSQQRTRWWRW